MGESRSWRPSSVESAARTMSLVLAAIGAGGWIFFAMTLGDLRLSFRTGTTGAGMVALGAALGVSGTVFSAAMATVAWVASLAADAVVRVDQDARRRLTRQL